MDSPLLGDMAGTGRSPGFSALKEAFDITYAVHRMEEEGNRRKGFLNGVNEEEDEDDEDAIMLDAAKKREGNGNARVPATGTRGVNLGNTAYSNRDAGRAGPRDMGERKRIFELNMGASTLLG
jgi:hypothetical protein